MLLGKDDPTENPAYTEEEIRRFQEDPKFHRQYRSTIIHHINVGFRRVSIMILDGFLRPTKR